MQLVSQRRLNDAYLLILDSGDDLYLVRLFALTRNCIPQLTRDVSLRFIERFVKIAQSKFVENICLKFIQDAANYSIVQKMPQSEQSQLKGQLRCLSLLPDSTGQLSQATLDKIESGPQDLV